MDVEANDPQNTSQLGEHIESVNNFEEAPLVVYIHKAK